MIADDRDPDESADPPPRRFRSFVARPTEVSPDGRQPDLSSGDDDIPLLTEIIEVRSDRHRNADALLAALREEIDNEVSAWLVNELPASVANASQQILEELDSKARNTLLPRLRTLLEAQRHGSEEAGDPPPSL